MKKKIILLCKQYRNEKGVALLLIMWVLFLLSIISAEFAFSMRTDFNITLNFKEEMEAYYLAQAGINQAIAKILHEKMVFTEKSKQNNDPLFIEDEEDDSPNIEWSKQMNSGSFSYELTDEEGMIDINSLKRNNTQDRKILRRLLENAAGVTDESTQNTIIDSIMDWMDTDELFKTAGAEDDYYQELSPPYYCKDGPFDTVEELLLVQGITKEILFGGESVEGEEDKQYPGIGQFLTVWTGGRFNERAAQLPVLVSKFGEEVAEEKWNTFKEEDEDGNLPTNKALQPSRHWTINAVGYPVSGESKRTIMARIKVIEKNKIPTVKILYWDDNYLDRYTPYEDPTELTELSIF